MYSLDEDMPPEDAGNQLRAKLNGVNIFDAATPTFEEVLYTAMERGIIDFRITREDALTIVRLHAVAHAIDTSPSPAQEVLRIQV